MPPPANSPSILLSYAPSEAEWTLNWLIPQLERNGVEVLNRDLLAGGARIEQLANVAEKARHTLLILSPDWVTSQWEAFTGLISHSADPLGQQRKTIPLIRQTCTPPRSIARIISADFTSKQPIEWERQLLRLLAVLRGQQYRTALGPPLGALLGLEAPTNFKFPRNQHFVGRDQELAELHELLDDAIPLGVNASRPDVYAGPSLAGLTGLGGVGKTQLVVEYIFRYWDAYPGGIFWINAADGVADDFAAIGKRILGNGHDKTDLELIGIAGDYLRSDPDTLLVLDNLNDLSLLNQAAAGILSPISLPCRLLFTTRRRDLRGMRSIAVDTLGESEALKLLLRSRLEILESTHHEHSDAIKVCATLGGLPLAIEMAAAYLEQQPDVSLAGYLKRLGREGSLQTLETFEQAKDWSPTWHDTIQKTLETQWEAVSNASARLLLQAAALMPEAKPMPVGLLSLLTGIEAVAKEGYPTPLAEALRKLHNYSLIEELQKGKQVRLHPLVREFARAQTKELDVFAKQCSAKMIAALEDLLRVNQIILRHGVDTLLIDLESGLRMNPGALVIEDLKLVLDQEAHNLRRPFGEAFPGFILQQIRNRSLNLRKMDLLTRVENALNELKSSWFRERVPARQETSALIRIFEGRSDLLTAMAITPDGKRVLCACIDGAFRLWDLESGQCLHTLEGHSGWVRGVAITPDGKRAVSASIDKTLRLWDLESGQYLHAFYGHSGPLSAVAITPDGKRALSGASDKTPRLWDLETGQCLRIFKGHSDIIDAVAITPDGKRAISASRDNTLRLWDLETGQCLCTFVGHSSQIKSVAITPDGKRAISTSFDNTLRLWSLENHKRLPILGQLFPNTARSLYTHKDLPVVGVVAITPDGKRALSDSWPPSSKYPFTLWDLETSQRLHTFEGHSSPITAFAITPDGKRAISASNDKTLRLWDLEKGKSLYTFVGHSSGVEAVLIGSDSKRALSSSEDGTFRLWNLESDQNLLSLERHSGDVSGVIITPDGKTALSGSWDNTLRLWDLETGRCLRTFEGHISVVSAMEITSDGKRALSGSWDNTLRLWDLETGQCIRTFEGFSGSFGFGGITLTPDGKHAFASSFGANFCLWDLETGQCLHTFAGHTSSVNDMVITPDGKRVLSASSDKTCRLWDLETGQCLHTFEGHSDRVTGVFSIPDGKRGLSASVDKTLRLWDLETGQCLLTFEGHSEPVYRVAISPDSKHVLSGCVNDVLRLWDLESGQLLRTFQGLTSVQGITRDCRRALSVHGDRTLGLWDLDSGSTLTVFADEVLIPIALHEKEGRLLIVGFTGGRPKIIEYVDGGQS